MATAHATAADYETFTGREAPADIDRLLLRATEAVDSAVLVDLAYLDEFQEDALRDATAAVVESWVLTYGEDDVDLSLSLPAGFSLGELSIPAVEGARSDTIGIGERARRILVSNGLLYRGVGTVGGPPSRTRYSR